MPFRAKRKTKSGDLPQVLNVAQLSNSKEKSTDFQYRTVFRWNKTFSEFYHGCFVANPYYHSIFRKEGTMKKELMNYEAILKVTRDIAQTRDPEEVALLVVESVKRALGAKGCALLLFNRKSGELEVASSFGLSDEYLNKGPLSAMKSIAGSLEDGPVAITDVADDPRIQYPEAAKKEGISSILSVPIIVGKNPIGALRVYSAELWEATLEDVNLVQALAQISGMGLELARLYKGLKSSIEILKSKRNAKVSKS